MKKRDIIIGKGVSGAYYADKFLPDNLPGYPGYHISKLGKVYSRWDINGKGVLRVRWHLKRPQPNRLGRLLVGITNGKKTKKFQVHRLVAMVYIPNPNNYPNVCHKDNNPQNNRASNLYWGTQKMNMNQASLEGRMVSKVKGLPKKLSDLQISYIPKLFERGFSYRDIPYIFNREASTATIKRWHFLYIKKYGL